VTFDPRKLSYTERSIEPKERVSGGTIARRWDSQELDSAETAVESLRRADAAPRGGQVGAVGATPALSPPADSACRDPYSAERPASARQNRSIAIPGVEQERVKLTRLAWRLAELIFLDGGEDNLNRCGRSELADPE
jgi:hypothetical protein